MIHQPYRVGLRCSHVPTSDVKLGDAVQVFSSHRSAGDYDCDSVMSLTATIPTAVAETTRFSQGCSEAKAFHFHAHGWSHPHWSVLEFLMSTERFKWWQDKGSRATAAYVNSAPDLQALQGQWPPFGRACPLSFPTTMYCVRCSVGPPAASRPNFSSWDVLGNPQTTIAYNHYSSALDCQNDLAVPLN